MIVSFYYSTADAQGMNMIVKATECACQWLIGNGHAQRFRVFSGMSSEKRASGFLLGGGKGKTVVAGARIPATVLQSYMRITPRQIVGCGTTRARTFAGQCDWLQRALCERTGGDVHRVRAGRRQRRERRGRHHRL